MKYIGLIDCNNFFVSCERLFRPDLNNRPVVVLSSNDGCVVARSKEIKDIGIPMGVPYFQVKDIMSEIKAVAFSSHFTLYRDISRRVFEVVSQKFEFIEQYSIDEAFFHFESNDPRSEIEDLKRQVEMLVGIPVSVGVSTSKTRAKYVNSVAKRTGGIAIWGDEDWGQKYELIKISEIWGVGRERTKAFAEKGIVNVKDLIALNSSIVAKFFGIEGVRLQAELLGKSVLEVKNQRIAQKSIMSTRSFAKTTTEYSVVEDAIIYHLYQGVKDLESMDLLANSLKIMIFPSRYGDYAFHGSVEEVTLTEPTRDLFILQKIAKKLLNKSFKSDVPYKKAGIVFANLVSPKSVSISLFTNEKSVSSITSELSKTLFDLNKKHGKDLIKLGRVEGSSTAWNSKKEALSPAYTTNWSDLKIVRAN